MKERGVRRRFNYGGENEFAVTDNRRSRIRGGSGVRPGDDARDGRGGGEGRQGRVVLVGRREGRRGGEEGVRREVSEDRRGGRALRFRASLPAHQPGIPVGDQERRRRE